MVDAFLDSDGRQRTILLGVPTEAGFKFSLALRLAQIYLEGEGILLKNGIKDPTTMGFGSLELPRFYPNSGGYVRGNAGSGSMQMLIRFRRGPQPFRVLTAEDIVQGNYDPAWLRDAIVLIGIATPSVPDYFSAAASSAIDPEASWVYGVEIHAHGVSQMISAVLDDRPLIQTWSEPAEYLWIVLWGSLGIALAAYNRSPWHTFRLSFCCGVGVTGLSYGLFLAGWWIPVVPTLAALGLSSIGLSAVYEYERRVTAVVAAKQQRILALQEANEILEQRVAERTADLAMAKERSDQLLLNILPESIADYLKAQNLKAQNQVISQDYFIAESFEQATILFADIVGFTQLSTQMSAIDLVKVLNQIFSHFDQVAEDYNLEKIKTIGDAYMVVGGVPTPCPDHGVAIAQMALAMQQIVKKLNAEINLSFQVRIGINTGQVVAGVIGIKKFAYDLWGDAVNVASRMESHGEPGKIQVSEVTYELLKHHYRFEPRGMVQIKGKGEMMTYFLLGPA
jgi:class 3 adenylate cyclase